MTSWQVAQWHSWTCCKQSKGWRGLRSFQPLFLRSEISFFWRTSCTRDFFFIRSSIKEASKKLITFPILKCSSRQSIDGLRHNRKINWSQIAGKLNLKMKKVVCFNFAQFSENSSHWDVFKFYILPLKINGFVYFAESKSLNCIF